MIKKEKIKYYLKMLITYEDEAREEKYAPAHTHINQANPSCHRDVNDYLLFELHTDSF
jgi:hypothetical protein